MITKSTDSRSSRKINQSLKMRKGISFIIILTVLLFPFAFLSSPVNSSAYLSSSKFFSSYFLGSSQNFSASSDGIFLFHSFYSSSYDDSVMTSPEKFNLFRFSSGTFQGEPVSNLASSFFYENDSIGFSSVMSYSRVNDKFIYCVTTVIPVVSGDSFTVVPQFNYNFIDFCFSNIVSFVPNGTGVRLVSSGSSSDFSYTLRSDNQHLAFYLMPSVFSSRYSAYSSPQITEDSSNLFFVKDFASFVDAYTTPYGLSSGSSISFTGVGSYYDSCSFVYEILTDGTSTPIQTTSPPVTTGSGTSGSSSDSGTDLSEISSYLRDILQAVLDKTFEVTVNVSSAVHEKLDAILTTLRELPSNMWECFKIGLADMFDIDISDEPEQPPEESDDSSGKDEDISFEIDQDSFNSAVESADIDKLDTSIGGDNGAIAFFWYFTNRFMNVMNLFAVVPLILLLSFLTWLIKG